MSQGGSTREHPVSFITNSVTTNVGRKSGRGVDTRHGFFSKFKVPYIYPKSERSRTHTSYQPPGSSTAGWLVTATKRSIVDNATSGRASTPRAWSIQTGQCSRTRRPPGAVFVARQRDHEAAPSNRRDALISALVTSQWRAQEGGDQPARSPWPPRRQHSRGPSSGCSSCCLRPFVRPGCDDHHSTR